MAWARDSRDSSGRDHALTATRDALAMVFREEAGRLAASVTRILGDFDAAEEVVQDALLAAWQQWPADGVPDRPGAWLWTVARRRAIDVLRRDARYRERARVSRWTMAVSEIRKARAISAVLRPQTVRSVSATCASRDSAG